MTTPPLPRDICSSLVFVRSFANYPKNTGGMGIADVFKEVLGDGIFAVDGEQWQTHRKVASHLFSTKALKTKVNAVQRCE